jgi:hypothetical protein
MFKYLLISYHRERFAGSWWFHFKYTLDRQVKLTLRDQIFIFARLAQCVLVGAIAGIKTCIDCIYIYSHVYF